MLIVNQLYDQLEGCYDQIDKVGTETKRLLKSLRTQKSHILPCLILGIPHHNNDSERPLRHVKNHMKISGFRSMEGAEQYAAYMSVYHTAKRRGLNPYQHIRSIITSSET